MQTASHTGLILAVAFVLFFLELGDLPFYSHGEPREALEVWDMVHRGEWILPLRNGVELPSKPPLFHWLGALTAMATGSVDEFSTRFPSALAATLTALAVYWRTRRWSTTAGLFAALVLMTNFEVIRAARAARVDMVLTACLTAAFLALEAALSKTPPRRPVLAALYLFTALAALTKGPVGIALPALTGLAWISLTRDFRRAWQMRPISGGLAVLVIAGSWYVGAIAVGGDAFVRKQLLAENFQRFVGVDEGGVNQSHPFYYYVQGIATGFAPWSVFLVSLGVSLQRHRGEIGGQSVRFLLICSAVIFVFYSAAAGKRTVYILCLYPILAILLGAWWAELSRGAFALPQTARRALRALSVVAAALLATVLAVFVSEAAGLPLLDRLGPLLHPRDRENLPLVRTLIRGHLPSLSLWLASLSGCVALLIGGARRGRWKWIFAAAAGLVIGIALVTNHVFHPQLAAERSFKRFSRRVAERSTGAPLHFYRTWDYGVVFYLGRRVPVISAEQFPAWTPVRDGYLLLFEEDWTALTGGDGRDIAPDGPRTAGSGGGTGLRLELVERSVERGHQGRTRLVLARVSAVAGAALPGRASRTSSARSAPRDTRAGSRATRRGSRA